MHQGDIMEYPKLNTDENCAYPKRKICNYNRDKNIDRCEYMKYDLNESILSSTRWKCMYKKTINL